MIHDNTLFIVLRNNDDECILLNTIPCIIWLALKEDENHFQVIHHVPLPVELTNQWSPFWKCILTISYFLVFRYLLFALFMKFC